MSTQCSRTSGSDVSGLALSSVVAFISLQRLHQHIVTIVASCYSPIPSPLNSCHICTNNIIGIEFKLSSHLFPLRSQAPQQRYRTELVLRSKRNAAHRAQEECVHVDGSHTAGRAASLGERLHASNSTNYGRLHLQLREEQDGLAPEVRSHEVVCPVHC